jgi:hypothetical protein
MNRVANLSTRTLNLLKVLARGINRIIRNIKNRCHSNLLYLKIISTFVLKEADLLMIISSILSLVCHPQIKRRSVSFEYKQVTILWG